MQGFFEKFRNLLDGGQRHKISKLSALPVVDDSMEL